MKKSTVKKLIAKAVAEARAEVEHELGLIGEHVTNHAERLARIEHPAGKAPRTIPLNPSDWHPADPVQPRVEVSEEQRQRKMVRFLEVGMVAPRYYYLTQEQLNGLGKAGVMFFVNYRERGQRGTYQVDLLPTVTTQNIGDLTRKVNAILAPNYRVYAEVSPVVG